MWRKCNNFLCFSWFVVAFIFSSCGIDSKKQPVIVEDNGSSHICDNRDVLNVELENAVPITDVDTIPAAIYKVVSTDMYVQWQFEKGTYMYRYYVEKRRDAVLEKNICFSAFAPNDSFTADFPVVSQYNFIQSAGVDKKNFAMQSNTLWLFKGKMKFQGGSAGGLESGNFSARLAANYSNWLIYKTGLSKYEIRAEKVGAPGSKIVRQVIVQTLQAQ